MPYADIHDRRKYQRNYYQQKLKPKRGVSEDRPVLMSVRLPSSLHGRLQRILNEGIANNVYPWKTMSQMVRDLLIAGMGTLKGDVVEEAMQYLKAVAPLDGIGNHRREAQAAFSRVKTELRELQEIKADTAAHLHYWAIVNNFRAMSPTVWRDWFLDQMEKTFPKFAKHPAKGIRLYGPSKIERRKRPRHEKSR